MIGGKSETNKFKMLLYYQNKVGITFKELELQLEDVTRITDQLWLKKLLQLPSKSTTCKLSIYQRKKVKPIILKVNRKTQVHTRKQQLTKKMLLSYIICTITTTRRRIMEKSRAKTTSKYSAFKVS